MAKTKLSLLLLLFLLILSSEIVSTEGRVVMKMSKSRNIHEEAIKAAMGSPSKQNPSSTNTIEDEVAAEGADYRPTTPGHSPGVGHATGPSSIGPDV